MCWPKSEMLLKILVLFFPTYFWICQGRNKNDRKQISFDIPWDSPFSFRKWWGFFPTIFKTKRINCNEKLMKLLFLELMWKFPFRAGVCPVWCWDFRDMFWILAGGQPCLSPLFGCVSSHFEPLQPFFKAQQSLQRDFSIVQGALGVDGSL